MNRRFLAMALAGVMAIGAFFTGAAPASLIGDDVSVVSASGNNYWIYFKENSYELEVGKTAAPILNDVVVEGKRLVRSDLKWISNDESIATVDSNGIITAVAEGSTWVRAEYWIGSELYDWNNISVTVGTPEGIKAILPQTVEVGGTITITPEMVKGSAITEKYFTSWSNGTKKTEGDVQTGEIISVNTKTGEIKGIAVGTAYVDITVTCGDKSYYLEDVPVTVTDKAGTVAKAEDGSGDYKIADPAKKEVSFAAPANTKKVVIPEKVVINGFVYKVTKIEDGAFKNNKKAVSVRLPESIKTIGANAFSGSKVKNVDMSATQVSEIGANAFSGTAPKEIIINGDNLKKVGKNAFKFKKSTKVYIESSSNKVYKAAAKKVKKNGKKVKTIEQD